MIHINFGVLFYSLPLLRLGNVLVVVGSIILVVTILDCMGSIKESKCLLMSFFVLLPITLLAEVTLAILLSTPTKVDRYAAEGLPIASNVTTQTTVPRQCETPFSHLCTVV